MKFTRESLTQKRSEVEEVFDVTFFVPCFNEEHAIVTTLDKIVSVAQKVGVTFEILCYNDGSTDGTKQLLEQYAEDHSGVMIRTVHHRKRKGLGYNYVDGSFLGFGKYYMMICGDNSETEESMIEILNNRGKAAMIIPYFGNRDTRNVARRMLSRLFTGIVNGLNGHKLKYYNGTVLHLRSNVMRWHPMSIGFAYQAELLSIMLDNGESYLEVLVSNNDRESGISRAFHLLNFLSVTHSILQILFRRIRKALSPS